MIRFAFLAYLLAAPFAFASGTNVNHYVLTGLSCNQARNVVAKEGVVIFHYGNDYFNRVVANAQYCDSDQTLEPFRPLGSKTDNCFMGFTCIFRPTGGP